MSRCFLQVLEAVSDHNMRFKDIERQGMDRTQPKLLGCRIFTTGSPEPSKLFGRFCNSMDESIALDTKVISMMRDLDSRTIGKLRWVVLASTGVQTLLCMMPGMKGRDDHQWKGSERNLPESGGIDSEGLSN